jgi:hypothetical protein
LTWRGDALKVGIRSSLPFGAHQIWGEFRVWKVGERVQERKGKRYEMTVEATQEQTPKNTHVIVNATLQARGKPLPRKEHPDRRSRPDTSDSFDNFNCFA